MKEISKRDLELICIGAHQAMFSYDRGESDKFGIEVSWEQTPEWIRDIARLRVHVILSNFHGFSRDIQECWVDLLKLQGYTLCDEGCNDLPTKKYSGMTDHLSTSRYFSAFDETVRLMYIWGIDETGNT